MMWNTNYRRGCPAFGQWIHEFTKHWRNMKIWTLGEKFLRPENERKMPHITEKSQNVYLLHLSRYLLLLLLCMQCGRRPSKTTYCFFLKLVLLCWKNVQSLWKYEKSGKCDHFFRFFGILNLWIFNCFQINTWCDTMQRNTTYEKTQLGLWDTCCYNRDYNLQL